MLYIIRKLSVDRKCKAEAFDQARTRRGRRAERAGNGVGQPGKQAEQEGTKDKAAPADEAGEEDSKRQSNIQQGRLKRLYQKAGFLVGYGELENRKVKTKGSKLLSQ